MRERDQEKWEPVFRTDPAQSKERTGAIVTRPVQKVCDMVERRKASAARLRGASRPVFLVAFVSALGLSPSLVQAEVIKNPIAVFAALDKVTGRISHLEIPINKTVEFGALKVTPRVCDSRPPTEAPNTSSFVEVDEVKLTGEVERIFTGWMFAESPGLHAVEHPVFDVWLTNCKTNSAPAPSESSENEAPAEVPPADVAAPAPPPPPPAAAAAPPPPPPPPKAAEAPEPLPWAKPPPPNAASRNR
jgi:hypothetical protein